MQTHFNTAKAAGDRKRRWTEVINQTYFPLELTFRNSEAFDGSLSCWSLGQASLSRLRSDALSYRRRRRHLVEECDQHFLVTIPAMSEVQFTQCGSSIRCVPGGFILERSHEPYEFAYPEANDLLVLKVPDSAISGRIRAADRYCSMTFDAGTGVGGLFVDMLRMIPARFDGLTREARTALGNQLADLLVLALKSDERALTSSGSSIREAHLMRIESFVRKRLHDTELDPETIAAACGISTRYLHDLFRDTNQTLGQWIRDQRLLACREALGDPGNNQTIAEIAYGWGFADHAQFSRAFKNQFGSTPTEYREVKRSVRTA